MRANVRIIERAVVAVGHEIATLDLPSAPSTESEVFEALAGCILSSRVRHDACVRAVERLRAAGLFLRMSGASHMPKEGDVAALLAARPLSYPFPARGARYVLQSVESVRSVGRPLAEFLRDIESASSARAWLVDHCLGVGPKQASLFLRKSGINSSLAVLDTHVLRFMAELSLTQSAAPPSTLARYERLEGCLQRYASWIGLEMALLDAAIWVVMRVLARGGTVGTRDAGVRRPGLDLDGVAGTRRRPETAPTIC